MYVCDLESSPVVWGLTSPDGQNQAPGGALWMHGRERERASERGRASWVGGQRERPASLKEDRSSGELNGLIPCPQEQQGRPNVHRAVGMQWVSRGKFERGYKGGRGGGERM